MAPAQHNATLRVPMNRRRQPYTVTQGNDHKHQQKAKHDCSACAACSGPRLHAHELQLSLALSSSQAAPHACNYLPKKQKLPLPELLRQLLRCLLTFLQRPKGLAAEMQGALCNTRVASCHCHCRPNQPEHCAAGSRRHSPFVFGQLQCSACGQQRASCHQHDPQDQTGPGATRPPAAALEDLRAAECRVVGWSWLTMQGRRMEPGRWVPRMHRCMARAAAAQMGHCTLRTSAAMARRSSACITRPSSALMIFVVRDTAQGEDQQSLQN